jgi:arginase
MTPPTTIRIFGVPMDLGQQRRGVDMGPSAVRYAGLQERLSGLGYQVIDHGNVPVPVVETMGTEPDIAIDADGEPTRAYHLAAVAQTCTAVYESFRLYIQPDEFAIFLGGDHSISMGTVAGVAARGAHGVIWVDAHADYNTPRTTPSGNIHGMSVAALLGDGPDSLTHIGGSVPILQAQQVAMIGIRNLDTIERQRLVASGIGVATMKDIDEEGIASIARKTLARFAGVGGIHISLDMDSIDPAEAPGVGTPVRGGLTYREAHLLMEIFAESGKVRSLDIVEINPILDTHNQTAELAVELAASLLGQRIL